MKKRFFAILLCLALMLSAFPAAAFAHSEDLASEEELARDLKALGLFQGVSDTNFALGRAPTRTEALVMLIRVLGAEGEALKGGRTHPFTDVAEWADDYVAYAFEEGLTEGVAPDRFGKSDASAAMYLTFVLRALGYSDENNADFTWSNPYGLAVKTGILPDSVDTENFLRADVVLVSYAALGARLKDSDKTLADKLIEAEVFTREDYEANIDLAKVGIVSTPEQPAAAAADPEEPLTPLKAKEIYARCAGAVFYIEMYDSFGDVLSTGSGFFIGTNGTAVTNYHVIEGASSASVMLSDGSSYDVEGIYDFSEDLDIALIKVNGSGFPVLTPGDPSKIVTGDEIFAIGSPLGFDSTISEGIISNVKRTMGEVDFIQFTAAISSGSSGGALIDEYGRVIGITSGSSIYGEVAQNVNFAIPISLVRELSADTLTDFSSLIVVPEAYLEVSKTEISLQEGETYYLQVYQSYDYDAWITYYPADDDVVKKSWGSWSSHYDISLVLTGLSEGTAEVLLVLTDDSGIEMDRKTVTVTVTKKVDRAELKFSNPSPSVKQGSTVTVTVTQNLDRDITVNYNLPEGSCVSCEWGEFTDAYSCPLHITGLSKGRSWIQVVLCDAYTGEVLTAKNMYVTVE
ncbi:MAG: trypsin-like peptidase domain-containing protein [Firmicutes bacterium]|nr:trypsin-like peptidase domain-containing protein [Bacillota bacterium]